MSKYIKIISISLSVLLCLSVSLTGCGTKNTKEKSPFETYKPISIDNEFCSLDVTDEGRVVIHNKADDTYTYSYPDGVEEDLLAAGQVMSALSVTTFLEEMSSVTTTYSYENSVMMGGLTVNRLENEIVAEYYFLLEEVTIPVHYTLDGEKLLVTVIPEEITEETARVTDIAIHPYFGSGSNSDDGFIFVPDGSGAIINFNQSVNSEYEQKLYSRDETLYSFTAPEKENASVMTAFGIGVNGKGSTFSIITGGAADATVYATAGAGVGYNTAYASFNTMSKDIRDYPNDYRAIVDIIPKGMKNTGPLQVTYYIDNNAEPDYMDFAKTYREYLVNKYGLTKMADSTYLLAMDVTMSTIKSHSFIGIPYDGIKVLTTAKQAEDMIKFFRENGVKTVTKLNNWSKETVWNKFPDSISFVSKLGSNKEFKSLLNTANDNGGVYLDRNATVVTGGNEINKKKYATNASETAVPLQNYNIVTGYRTDDTRYLLSNKSVVNMTSDFLKAFDKKIPDFVGIGFSGINVLCTDYSAKYESLSATAEKLSESMALTGKRNTAVTVGNEYALKVADFLFETPSDTSEHDNVSYRIPFYQIALHGYVPFTLEAVNSSANPQELMLRTLESGANLCFDFINADADEVRYSTNDELYSANFDLWKNTALGTYKDYEKIMADKQNLEIVDHKRLADGVTYTQYENGDAVIVNYNANEFNFDGIVVDAVGYKLVKGER